MASYPSSTRLQVDDLTPVAPQAGGSKTYASFPPPRFTKNPSSGMSYTRVPPHTRRRHSEPSAPPSSGISSVDDPSKKKKEKKNKQPHHQWPTPCLCSPSRQTLPITSPCCPPSLSDVEVLCFRPAISPGVFITKSDGAVRRHWWVVGEHLAEMEHPGAAASSSASDPSKKKKQKQSNFHPGRPTGREEEEEEEDYDDEPPRGRTRTRGGGRRYTAPVQ